MLVTDARRREIALVCALILGSLQTEPTIAHEVAPLLSTDDAPVHPLRAGEDMDPALAHTRGDARLLEDLHPEETTEFVLLTGRGGHDRPDLRKVRSGRATSPGGEPVLVSVVSLIWT